jgi:hypothetical protein
MKVSTIPPSEYRNRERLKILLWKSYRKSQNMPHTLHRPPLGIRIKGWRKGYYHRPLPTILKSKNLPVAKFNSVATLLLFNNPKTNILRRITKNKNINTNALNHSLTTSERQLGKASQKRTNSHSSK